MQADDSSFLKRITFKDLRESYLKKSRELKNSVKLEIQQRGEKLVDDCELEISRAREHDQIVNLCIHPFSESNYAREKLGYVYLRPEPLFEKGERNFDFLICRKKGKRPIAIFGEVKSSITNFHRVLAEFEQKVQSIEKNRDYIRKKYIGTTKDILFEYVFAVKSSLALEARDIIWEDNKKIILWVADLYDGTIRIGHSLNQKGHDRFQHHDPRLTRYLGRPIQSSKNSFDFFPQSHTLLKLKILVMSTETENVISTERLRKLIFANYFCFDEKIRQREFDSILKAATDIKFLVRDSKKPQFRIVSAFTKTEELESELIEKWKRAKLIEIEKELYRRSLNALQTQILNEQAKIPTLC